VIRVAIEASAVPARLTGAGVYVARLLAAMASRDDVEAEVFCAPGSAAALAVPGLPLHPVAAARGGGGGGIIWTQTTAQ
jgi:hypothetical protein